MSNSSQESSPTPRQFSFRVPAAILMAAMLTTAGFTGPVSPANAATMEAGDPIVDDSMTRTVTGSWGKSPSGVNYYSTASNLSVFAGTALMPLSSASSTTTVRTRYDLMDSESSVKVKVPVLPTGSAGVYTSLFGRDSGTGNYRSTLRILPTGKTVIEISRWNSGGGTTQLKSVSLPLTVKAGQQFNLKLRVTGKPKVVVESKVWAVGQTEPTEWSASFTDSSASAITTKGMTSISGYRGSGSQAMTLAFDDLKILPLTQVSDPAPAPAPTPTPTPTPAPLPDTDTSNVGSQWGTPVFSDDFGTTSLNKWIVRDDSTHGVLSYDRAVISKDNASTSNGLLHLEGKKLDTPVVKSGERWFSTAYIDTIGKFSQKYGRWEMRAKLPLTANNSKGIWPAFWLRPDGGATGGEIDIMEAYGTPTSVSFDPQNRAEGTLHYDQTGKSKTNSWIPVTSTLSSEFHTWTFEWTPQGMKWLFDGKEFKSVDRAGNAAYEAAFETNAKFHMRLNTQYGSPYWGMPDVTNSSVTKDHSDFQVDYVKAWSYKG
ncbi:family 16 glycosylhydrolase [Paeniglutamicibacter sp. Y32M11]|uniref:glycoside hydrolase family 16 protein n=1 Tax=Paeniglutamicibacter sp. Y32M11 TaxID=2853258 RepID=UPI001C52CC00|nr:glycoside hydrolase family 16 protein [Paeniglutamicibacter sp. Y32M11]QXQ11108.1 glycoside hydrolase family 16 protein [Paeniglutamicibacter sp. Y32M11]